MPAAKIKVIEQQVKRLDRDGLAAFRDWFRKYDAESWDRQVERDSRNGKLGRLARHAVSEHKAGKTREL